jgi:hypothetical protein
VGCEYAVACHRDAAPILRRVTTRGARTAGLYVVDASADARDCRFVDGEKFGVYVDGSSAPVLLHDVEAFRNRGVGVQILGGDVSIEGGLVAGNEKVGILARGASPQILGVTIADGPNVGVVLEQSGASLTGCAIHDNEYGVVVSLGGEPRITRCVFEDNRSYQLGIEGEADPLIGGSAEDANRFLGNDETCVSMSSSARVNASYNFWGELCPPDGLFDVEGGGELTRVPWMSADLTRSFEDCDAARADSASAR